jgi:hypothetical protein
LFVEAISAFVAACAAIISLAALKVSIGQARLTREHNRRSVKPVLQFRSRFRTGEPAGLRLTNVGLGPARIMRSEVRLDGELMGEYSRDTVNRVRDRLVRRPSATTFDSGTYLATDYDEFLLYVPGYQPETGSELAELIEQRVKIELVYESLYGDEDTAAWPQKRARHSHA